MPRILPSLLLALLASPLSSQAPLPLKYVGPPTVSDITPGDLMTRLYIFADDSMMGRRVGTIYNDMGTAYIEREVRKLGLTPAGDSGGYFQKVPLVARMLDTASSITIDGTVYRPFVDFVMQTAWSTPRLDGIAVVAGGETTDTLNILPPDSVKGRLLVIRQGAPAPGYMQTNGFRLINQMISAAGGIVVALGDQLPPGLIAQARSQNGTTLLSNDQDQIILYATGRLAEAMLGAPLASAARGMLAKPVTSDLRFSDAAKPGRNVVAILQGSDPTLKSQYVAIGAHNDHVGFNTSQAEHDSVKAFKQVIQPQGADSPPRRPNEVEVAQIRAITDSLRQIYPPRTDSIFNGADDDGSGSMTVLEIAELFAKGREKPKRSILFIWHTGEEAGLYGASHFVSSPTVPRDAIVAQLNMDMVGRGGANDVTGEDKAGGLLKGGPGYLQLIGSRRLSTELGDLIETVNTEKKLGFKFDYAMDANGHPQNIYCRSDHYEYAKHGIPIVFFTTGGHADYHQVTDEPQYIDYPHLADVARLVYWSAMRLGNLDHRVVVDKPKPDPKGNCVQ